MSMIAEGSWSSFKLTSLGGTAFMANVAAAAFTPEAVIRIFCSLVAAFVGLGTLYFLRRKDKRDQEKHQLLLSQHQKLMEASNDGEA